jgi:hypothetical protein
MLGTKGRVAFEAPAAEILLVAHRELEKLVLSGPQQRIKDLVAAPYGDFVHEGKQLDPACRDIEALLTSSQARVTGEVKIVFRPGSLFVEGVTSPHSLLAATKGVYGEKAGEWTPPTPWATPASCPCPACCRRGRGALMAAHDEDHRRGQDRVGRPAAAAEARAARLCEIPCEEGVVIAAEVLTNKSTYNTLELTSGRMAQVKRGDIVVGALGHRQGPVRLLGPRAGQLAVGDTLQLLNIGGVIGICDAINPSLGQPFDVRVLGSVLHFPYLGERIGVPARIGMAKLPPTRRWRRTASRSSPSPAPA